MYLCFPLLMFIHLIILAKITGSEVDLMTLARDVVFSAVVPVLFGEGILPQTHQEFKHFQKQFDQFDSNFEHGAKLPDFLLKEWAKSKYFLLDVFGKALQKKAYANVEDTLLQAMVESLESDCAPNYATLLLWASLANAVPITFWTLAFVLSDQGIKKDLQKEVDLVLGPYIDSGKYTRLLLSLPEVLQYLSEFLTLSLLYLISNSPYCLPYSPYSVSPENLVLDQLTIAQMIFLSILITCLLDIVLIFVRRNSVLVTPGSEKVNEVILA